MVAADFPGVSDNTKLEIYSYLKHKGWIIITDFEADSSTIWKKIFENSISDEDAKKSAFEDFYNGAKYYCNPKLVVHCGPGEPTTYNYIAEVRTNLPVVK
jgi:hypothetical protein